MTHHAIIPTQTMSVGRQLDDTELATCMGGVKGGCIPYPGLPSPGSPVPGLPSDPILDDIFKGLGISQQQ